MNIGLKFKFETKNIFTRVKYSVKKLHCMFTRIKYSVKKLHWMFTWAKKNYTGCVVTTWLKQFIQSRVIVAILHRY